MNGRGSGHDGSFGDEPPRGDGASIPSVIERLRGWPAWAKVGAPAVVVLALFGVARASAGGSPSPAAPLHAAPVVTSLPAPTTSLLPAPTTTDTQPPPTVAVAGVTVTRPTTTRATTTTRPATPTTTTRPSSTTTKPGATTTTTKPPCVAAMSSTKPAQNTVDTLTVSGAPAGTTVTAVVAFSAKKESFTARTDATGRASIAVPVGTAPVGVKVAVNVTVGAGTCATSFTPA